MINRAVWEYRVWDEEKQEYDYDTEWLLTQGGILARYESDMCVHAVSQEDKKNHYVVERCTGLKDKSGKLIYEGDVCAIQTSWEPVRFDLYEVGWSGYQWVLLRNGVSLPLDKEILTLLEVVDNIREKERDESN